MAEGGGQTQRDPSGWTVDTAKEHLAERIDHIEDRLNDQLQRLDERYATLQNNLATTAQTSKNAQEKFETSVADRFTTVNEFRNSLDDLGKQMATRRELETATASIGLRIDDLTKSVGDLRSRIDVGPAALQQLQQGEARRAGRDEGVELSKGTLFASIAALATIIGLIVLYANKGSDPAVIEPPPVTVTVPSK